MKKIGVLTSSRADYGIYKPLLNQLVKTANVDVTRIVFGPHLLPQMESSLAEIKSDPYGKYDLIGDFKETNTAVEVTTAYGKLVQVFASYWGKSDFDLVIALGDRFEMSAAIQAAIPFNIKIAHIHGGETTLGAIDNIYRHQISLASKLHFTATQDYAQRVASIVGSSENIHCVGALSLSDLEDKNIKPWDEVRDVFSIPKGPFVLVTVHPETADDNRNAKNIVGLSNILTALSSRYHLLITGTNTDQSHEGYTRLFLDLKRHNPSQFTLVDSMGRENYFSALSHCTFVLGNSSSGIIEVASFGKFTIDLGDRQKGRSTSLNTTNMAFDAAAVLKHIKELNDEKFLFTGGNVYFQKNTVGLIIDELQNQIIQ
jgi:GDP/UDP-N,N'-diacetylbacillosamine 2-epimerase (hydrolysing)